MNEEEEVEQTIDEEDEEQLDAGTTKPSTAKSGGDTVPSSGKKAKKGGKKGKGGKKKGKKKKVRKIKLAKDLVMNDRGEIVSTREYLLEKTLASTTHSLHSCQRRLEELTSSNEILQESVVEQEKDALQVISALHKDNEKVEEKMKGLQLEIKRLSDEMKVISDNVKEEYEKKLSDLKAVLAEKESAYRVMQQEFAVIKDFRRKRQDLLKELENSKIEQTESEKRHRDIVHRLEKKFFEEKIRLQKDANKKIGELATKAHKEAVTNLKDTTKDVYKENIRMSEALIYHVEEGKELNRMSNELLQKNRELTEENELHHVIVKEKIMQSKKQESEIERLKEKMYSMEHALTHVVQEFEQERLAIGKLAKAELAEVKKVVTDLSTRLATKTIEMRHIRRLAQHILDQRTEMEEFFMDSLEHVKTELKKEKGRELRKNLEKNKQSMKELLKNKTAIPEIGSFKYVKKNTALNTLHIVPAILESDEKKGKVDIKDLTWQDKERILRILFSKMNGVSLADEAENQTRAYDAQTVPSKHRTGFAELEPIVLNKAANAVVGASVVDQSNLPADLSGNLANLSINPIEVSADPTNLSSNPTESSANPADDLEFESVALDNQEGSLIESSNSLVV